MNPLMTQFAGAAVRLVVNSAGASMVLAWLVSHGFLKAEQIDELTVGASVMLAGFAWSLWQKYASKRLANTQAAMKAGTTIEDAKSSIARGVSAPASTGAGDVPVLINTNPGDAVKPRVGAWFLPLLLVSSLAAGPACATVQPNPPVDSVQKTRNEAATLAKATKEAATLAVEARRVAQAAYDSKAISATVMQKINNAALQVSEKGLAFITFAETVTTDPSLRVTATELYKVFQGLIDALGESGQTGAAIKTALQAFIVYLGVQ